MAYQAGDRVALVHTSDPHTRLIPGTAGTVTGYDDRHGQLAVAWDDGSSLAMLLRDGDQVRLLAPRPQRRSREPAQHHPVSPPPEPSRPLRRNMPPVPGHAAEARRSRPPASARRPKPPAVTSRSSPSTRASGRQDITDPATGGSRLLSRQCATCILRHGDPMHLGPERLREIIGQTLAAGSFVVCHDTLTYGDFPGYGPAAVKAESSRSGDTQMRDLYRLLIRAVCCSAVPV
jgi:hypothetical protein